MAVTVLCPRLHCRAVLRVPDQARGKQVRCAECGTTFLVPQAPKKTSHRSKPAEPEKPKEGPVESAA